MDLSDKIRQVREQKRIKKSEVANALELDQSYYSRLESRGNKMTLEQLERIASVLKVSIIELLSDEPVIDSPNQLAQENENLQKRVAELEKWLADKDARIASNQREIRAFKEEVNNILFAFIDEYIEANNLIEEMFDITVKLRNGKTHTYYVHKEEFDEGFEHAEQGKGTFLGQEIIELESSLVYEEEAQSKAVEYFISTMKERYPFSLTMKMLFKYCDDIQLLGTLEEFKESRRYVAATLARKAKAKRNK